MLARFPDAHRHPRRLKTLEGAETMQRTRAPFRADEVGSLLRPQKIKEARAKLEKGEISADELRKIEGAGAGRGGQEGGGKGRGEGRARAALGRPPPPPRRQFPPLLVAFRLPGEA